MSGDIPSTRATLIIVSLVLIVAASSFGISRLLIYNSIEKAKPIAEQRTAQRNEMQAAERQQAMAQARQDTITHLLSVLEEKLQQNPLDSMLLISAGNIAYDLQQYDKAARFYRTFIDNINGHQTAVKIDYGFAVFQTGKQQEGLQILRNVLQAEPRNQTALFNLAYMYQQLDNLDSTRRLLTECRDADPTSTIGQNAARVLTQLSKPITN